MTDTIIVPARRPELAKAFAVELLRERKVYGPAIVGRRGYYRDTMGEAGANDWGLYDDALAVYFPKTPTQPEVYVTFNANTDPSREHYGVAVLEPGVWLYKLGIHGLSRPATQRYEALVQADEVIVERSGTQSVPAGVQDERGHCLGQGRWRGWFGINHHHGGYRSTSSEGCQTVWPEQWGQYLALAKVHMLARGMKAIPYVLSAREDA
jgi:hypothetical protein